MKGNLLINTFLIGIFIFSLFGCSVSNSGINDLPDSTPFPEPKEHKINNSYYPAMVWNGSGYGAVWEKSTNDGKAIYFAQIATNGDVKNDSYVEAASLNPDGTYMAASSIAWNSADEEYGIVWSDLSTDGGYEIYFRRIDVDASKKGGLDPVKITDNNGYSTFPAIIWNEDEGEYGIVWRGGEKLTETDIYFVRISIGENNEIIVSDDLKITDDKNSGSPSLVYNAENDEYAAAWVNFTSADEICFQRINKDSNGNSKEKGERVKISNDSSNNDLYPSLVWNAVDEEYAVAWRKLIKYDDDDKKYPQIYFARINDGGLIDNSRIQITDEKSSKNFPSLIWSGSQYSITWIDTIGGSLQIYFAGLQENGTGVYSKISYKDDAIKISDSNLGTPSFVCGGSGYGLAWVDVRNGSDQEIYFQQISAEGNKENGNDVKISQ